MSKDIMRICPKHRAQFDEPPVFTGDGRYGILDIFDNNRLMPSCHSPFQLTALVDEAPVTTLSTQPDNGRLLEICGVDGGYVIKGRDAVNFVIGDTTTESKMVLVKLACGESWVQTEDWRLTLNIASGEVTGKMTFYGPPFNLSARGFMFFWLTNDGASYYGGNAECDFSHFAAGSTSATEDLTSDILAGSSVICLMSDTSGFYLGDKVYLKDSENDEWCRITAIDSNISITVNTLTNDYTIGNGASINKDVCIQTPAYRRKMRRCLINYPSMTAGINTGVTSQMGLPHSMDNSEDVTVLIQYMGSADNATDKKIKMRLQYITIPIGDVCEPSDERGIVKYGYLTPPAVAYTHYYESIFTVPQSDIGTAHAAAFQVVRLGADAEDTYDGDLTIIAVLVLTKNNSLGMDI